VLLCYLDESASNDHYFIAALIVPEVAAAPLTAALDAVVADAARSYGVPADTELHGHEIFQARGPWEPFAKEPRIRIGVYNHAFQAIGDHDVRLILRGMNVKRQRERYTQPDKPHSVVLAHVLERVDEYAARQGELALVIADEVEGQNDYRRDLWSFQRKATWGYRSRQLTRIVDTMHFVPSHHSRLVQGADLVAFLHRRRSTHVENDERAKRANEALWERVNSRVEHDHTWWP
jgi:hypothetical protein